MNDMADLIDSWRINFAELTALDDGVPTTTTIEQSKVERGVIRMYKTIRDRQTISHRIQLIKERHLTYLKHGIKNLSHHFESLDASRPWICYWILHSMELLNHDIPPRLSADVVDFLKRCQHPDGGFGGGPGQYPHLAPTYAAVLTLCIIGTQEAYNAIDRPRLQIFLSKMHQPDGSYIMHTDGETDVRGAYCAIVSGILTNTIHDEMIENTAEWIASCQTYEGGFSAVPGTEAHGGYSFCGFAALVLLHKDTLCDIHKLLKWSVNRQMKLEGGFQGRTNKMVDGCYSFWMGGIFPLLYMSLKHNGDKALDSQLWQFQQESLQEYILFCCQAPLGGLIDKPGKNRDFYHTCYCLSGLSISQHCFSSKIINITGNATDILEPTHPTFNISLKKAFKATEHFSKQPVISIIQT